MPNVYIQKPHHKQERDSSCVPACTKMMLEFFKITVSESELRILLKTKSFGTHLFNSLILNDKDYQIRVAIQYWSLEELKVFLEKEKTPCIVPVWTEFLAHWDCPCLHTVIVNGIKDEQIIINDPYFEEKEFLIPTEDFLNSWQINDGLVITFKRKI